VQSQKPETISSWSLQHYSANPPPVKKLLNFALTLAGKNLGYRYGSADPKHGGMDCSGTVYYLLTSLGIKNVPRPSHLIYKWVKEKGHFHAVNTLDLNSAQFAKMRPGDILFWNGTYRVQHNPNITHVMLYLGKNKAGQPLMIGASNGRSYNKRKIYGVSVFNFDLPHASSKSKFLGYSCIPHLSC